MGENKNALINLIPETIDNATKNLSDPITKSIGATLDDIWYLVFGGISQTANMRRLKYASELQKFEEEIKEKVFRIPEDKLVEPDMQIIGPILDASKYCVEKIDIRQMFSTLIESSLNIDYCGYVHPSYVEIIKQMSPLDARIFKIIMSATRRPIISIEI